MLDYSYTDWPYAQVNARCIWLLHTQSQIMKSMAPHAVRLSVKAKPYQANQTVHSHMFQTLSLGAEH